MTKDKLPVAYPWYDVPKNPYPNLIRTLSGEEIKIRLLRAFFCNQIASAKCFLKVQKI